MAGKLSTRDFDEEEVKWLAQFAAAMKDPLPHDPRNLRAIIRALQYRLHHLNPAEANLVKGLLQGLAAIERNPVLVLAPETRQKLYSQYVGAIARAKPSRGSHNESVLRMQRDLLSHYLAMKPYPTKSPDDRWPWIKEHWADILALMTGFPCLHQYNVELGADRKIEKVDYNELTYENVFHIETPGRIRHLILAHLHGTTPAQIEKLLKPTSR